MIGAIIGDIAGSRFERHNNKSKKFKLFDKGCHPTDDSVMLLAIAEAILTSKASGSDLAQDAVQSMQDYGRTYPKAGYGGQFSKWLAEKDPHPYESFGNGAAMRVGPCGYAAETLDEAKSLSHTVTGVTHNHPDGLKGAETIAVAVFLARHGKRKDEIRSYVNDNYYQLDFTLDEIRKSYKFDVSCKGSVPQAIEAFLEASDFEDAIRNAISIGGDSDTIAAMAGAIAEAYFGIPEGIITRAIEFLDSKEMATLYYFEKMFPSMALDENGKQSRTIFDLLDDAVDKVIPEGTSVEVDDSGVMRAWVSDDDLIPDFSSFDINARGKTKVHREDPKATNGRSAEKGKRTYVKSKKKMNFQSVESMQTVVNVVNEASAALGDKTRTIRESAIPEVLAGALGAGIGGVGSFAALYGLGTVGLSAAGITSGLATAGALVGGGVVSNMVAGMFVLATPVAVFAAAGVGTASYLKNKQLKQEKERLYKEALRKRETIIKAMKTEADADKERMDYLQSLNILLQQAIKDLQKDLGINS